MTIMQYCTLISVIVAGITAVQAAPAAAGFSSQCTDIHLNNGWLVGSGDARLKSSVFLPNKIVNKEATLGWQRDGIYWGSCVNCALINAGAGLECYCKGTFAGTSKKTTINLEEHIANYNGHLLSNLDSAPVIPPNSAVPVPDNFSLDAVFGYSDNLCASGQSLDLNYPQDCYTFKIVPAPFYNSLTTTNQGWEIIAYDNENCLGDPVGDLYFTNSSVCHNFIRPALGFAIKPLWNAD